MKLAVVGSRTFTDYARMCSVLDVLKPDVIVSGGASGADRLSERYAKEHGIKTEIYLADWDRHGRAAGIIRNAQIVKSCDEVVAFWDGQSRGTANTIERARQMRKKVHVELFS